MSDDREITLNLINREVERLGGAIFAQKALDQLPLPPGMERPTLDWILFALTITEVQS